MNGHRTACPCVKCDPARYRSQKQPLKQCPKHHETKVRRPDGTVHCRSCVRASKAAKKKRNARWLRYPSQEAELYRRAAEVRAQRKKKAR